MASIDRDACVTGAYALFHHGYITQVPREIDCFTRRRLLRDRLLGFTLSAALRSSDA